MDKISVTVGPLNLDYQPACGLGFYLGIERAILALFVFAVEVKWGDQTFEGD